MVFVLVIVADDLTGALDTAAPFAARGLHTEVVLRANDVAKGVALFPDVLSINLASRDGSSEDAFDLMQELVGRLPSNTRMFKKVDSRLKGHIASELDAVSFDRALVAPAIPTFGRVVRNGNVEGFGVAEPLSVASALKHHAHRATIPDTVTENELDAALQRAEEIDVDLLVGARGLAEALARKMTKVSRGRQVSPPGGRGLFVIGSRDGITLDQVKELRQCDGVAYHPAPNGTLPEGPITPASLLLVQATEGELGLSSEEVSRSLAHSVHPRLTSEASTLLLCGGATAEAALAAMGVTHFRLEGECMPGLGLAYANGQCIILKSGGFGEPDTLAKLARQIVHGRS